MGYINKATIAGRVGRDPEIKTTQDGVKFANLSVATSEFWNDQSGQKQSRTQWHRVVVWNERLVKLVEGYVRKGSEVYIEGQMELREWADRDGIKRQRTEIVLKKYQGDVQLFGSKPQNTASAPGQTSMPAAGAAAPLNTQAAPPPMMGAGPPMDSHLDDHIPYDEVPF